MSLDPDQLDRLDQLGERWAETGGDPAALAAELGLDASVARRYLLAQEALEPFGLADTEPPLADHVGAYRIGRELGRGAMGRVLEAVGPDGVTVALKVLDGNPGVTGAARFAREARVLARLDHENVVQFFGAGHDGRHAWLAMELVAGVDLKQRLQEGPLPAEEARSRVLQVARALEHAHGAGVIHRDLKPSNILLAQGGRTLVTDFGVSRVCEESGLTQTGALIGTPAYMAPEQIEGQPAGEPADVWALGVVLYHCLTGRPPFEADSLTLLSDQILSGRVPAMPGVPSGLRATCRACLAQEPAERPSPGQVAEALSSRRALGPSAGQRVLAGALVGVGLTLALAVVAARGGSDSDRELAEPPSLVTSPVSWRPEPPAGWREAWALENGPLPRVESRSLWIDPGRAADPLRGVRGESEAALKAAFGGQAELQAGGRVRVRYAPPRACLVELRRPGSMLEGADALAGATLQGGETRLVAPDDRGTISIRLGRSHWQHAALELDARALPREAGAYGAFSLQIGHPLDQRASLSFVARQSRVSISRADAPSVGTGFALPPGWTAVRWAPGAPAGQRVRLGEDPAAQTLDAAANRHAPPGAVWLNVGEERVAVRRVAVSGVPLSVDHPARAWSPVTGSTSACIAARFRAEAGVVGGPRLELGTAETRYTLTLEPGRLLLERRGRPLASAALPSAVASGWLTLLREGDELRGSITGPSGRRIELEVQDPLSLGPGEVSLAYGSSGCETRFDEVRVFLGPSDAERASWDAGEDQGTTSARGRWRQAARALQDLTDPTLATTRWGDLRRSGEVRRELAAEVAQELEVAGSELPDAARADCLARATLAWVLAERPAEAKAAAERLTHEEGAGAAVRLDRLLHYGGRPALLEQLARGFAEISRRPRIKQASCAVVLGVQAGDRLHGLALQTLADLYEEADPQASLALLARAAPLAEKPWEVHVRAARILLNERDAEGALERLELAQPPAGAAYPWQLRVSALLALGRLEGAVEAWAVLLALAPERARAHLLATRPGATPPPLEQSPLVARALANARPAYRAVMALLISRLPGLEHAEAVSWRDRAVKLAEEVPPAAAPRDRDLARYVEAAVAGISLIGVLEGDVSRPSQILLRARLGNEGERQRLSAAGDEDPFVLSLALSDEVLASWVR